AFGLLGNDLEAEPVGDGARLGLRPVADGKEHAPNDIPVNAPQEVRLIFPRVETAVQRAVDDPRVVPGGDPSRVDSVGLVEQIAKLREGVASHAWNRRTTARVLVHEIADDVAPEGALEIEDV